MVKSLTTRRFLANGQPYPVLYIKWIQDKDQFGYTGNVILYDSKDSIFSVNDRGIQVYIRQTSPIGYISFGLGLNNTTDTCYDSGVFEGVEIKERDLQWITMWVCPVLRNIRQFYKVYEENFDKKSQV